MPENLYNLKNQRGYIALMSAIVISGILIMLTFILSLTTMFARFNILDAEYKKKSLGLAEACADMALLKLAGNIDYVLAAADHSLSVSADPLDICDIVDIQPSIPRIGMITVKVRGVYQNSHSNIEIKADSGNNLSINSWKEMANF
jgi:hypothetical protein